MDRFEVQPTPLAGAVLLERKPIADRRGFLERLYDDGDLASILDNRQIRQVNRTLTGARGAVRGMHFQRAPYADLKIVHCLRGAVFDVVVDLRDGSPTFGQWHSVELSGDGHRSFVVPEGFAHGFQTLTENCEMLYFHTAAYVRDAEGGVSPFDPALAIDWPLEVTDISDRDRGHPAIGDRFRGL